MNNTTAISIPNNRGKIMGTLRETSSHKFEVEGEIFYEGKIEVERLSETTDLLPFTISEKIVKSYDFNFEIGQKVSFGGEFRSYNRMIDGKSRLILSFFVKEIFDFDETENQITNELNLVGYICKEPVYRVTPFNRQICDILLAVNRPNFNKSDYIPCILWGRNAKFIQNQKVGTKISLIGRIQSRNYKKEVGNGVYEERTAYEVSCQKLTIENQAEPASEGVGA